VLRWQVFRWGFCLTGQGKRGQHPDDWSYRRLKKSGKRNRPSNRLLGHTQAGAVSVARSVLCKRIARSASSVASIRSYVPDRRNPSARQASENLDQRHVGNLRQDPKQRGISRPHFCGRDRSRRRSGMGAFKRGPATCGNPGRTGLPAAWAGSVSWR